jgi:hypothetical protein
MPYTKPVRGMILIILLLLTLAIFVDLINPVYAQPSVTDTSLNVEAAVEGLSSPTSLVFLDENDILVLEKEGNVRLVANGILQEQPILQVPVNAEGERGLLGVAILNGSNGSNGSSSGSNQSGQTTTNVFLYYTEGDPLRNRVYKYQ